MTSLHWNFLLESSDPDWGCEAYVGLRVKGEKVTLRVPHGYPTGHVSTSLKSNILGELMCVAARFSGAFPQVETSEHDGFLRGVSGGSLIRGMDGADTGYSVLILYVALIRQLLDPRLLVLTKAPGLTAQFDHRHISRNLHRATFLPDGTPVFDQLWMPRTQMRRTTNDMVGLACWLALDGLAHLFPDSAEREIGTALQSEWDELARRFADDHGLKEGASLFSNERSATLRELQSALEICLRREPPVSAGARDLSHLLDELLSHAFRPEEGDILGLKGFHHVWEAACLERAIEEYGLESIYTCDYQNLTGIDSSTRERWCRNRCKIFDRSGIARCPDLVVKESDGTYRIIDFKYYAESASIKFVDKRPPIPSLDLCKTNPRAFCQAIKASQDIASIEAYRWLLMQHELRTADESKVRLELWMPCEEEKDPDKCKCDWMTNLNIVYKPAREIMGAYARTFPLAG